MVSSSEPGSDRSLPCLNHDQYILPPARHQTHTHPMERLKVSLHFVIPPVPASRAARRGNSQLACGKFEREMTSPKSPWMRGPEGRPLNVSPARQGWGISFR